MFYKSKQLAEVLFSFKNDEKRLDKIMKNFFIFCKQYGLLPLLPKVVENLKYLQKKELLNKSADITTAIEINKNTTELIKKLVSADKTLFTNNKIDKNIKGGFIVNFNNKIYDASIAGQLNKLKNKLLS